MSDFTIERHERVVTVSLPDLHILQVLNHDLLAQVLDTLRPLDKDPDVGCFVVAVRPRLFAADTDMRSTAAPAAAGMAEADRSAGWKEFARLRTPKVAAVDGSALGSGCELALMCDVIIAGEAAVFGRPEIKWGAVPGADSTERLARLIGRAKAMDLILTGRPMGVREAERCGLVSRVVADGQALVAAAQVATKIASHDGAAIKTARESVDRGLEAGSRDSALLERRAFHALFSQDQPGRMRKVPRQRPPHFWS